MAACPACLSVSHHPPIDFSQLSHFNKPRLAPDALGAWFFFAIKQLAVLAMGMFTSVNLPIATKNHHHIKASGKVSLISTVVEN